MLAECKQGPIDKVCCLDFKMITGCLAEGTGIETIFDGISPWILRHVT